MAEITKFIGTGKRKSSVARVSLFYPGKGKIEVNGIDVDNYVPRDSYHEEHNYRHQFH